MCCATGEREDFEGKKKKNLKINTKTHGQPIRAMGWPIVALLLVPDPFCLLQGLRFSFLMFILNCPALDFFLTPALLDWPPELYIAQLPIAYGCLQQ